MGNRALSAHKKLKLNKRRVQDIIEKTFDDKYKSAFYPARQLIDLARNIGLGLPDMPDFDLPALALLADDYDIAPRDKDGLDLMLAITRSTLLTMNATSGKDFDFTDMLYLPLFERPPVMKLRRTASST
jgi:hypothetical protein